MQDGDVIDASERTLTIMLVDCRSDTISFKVRRSTSLHKVFEAYAAQRGITKCSLAFSYEGEKLYDHKITPDDLDMEDGDTIDVMEVQVGC
jgi:hypothetical protein